MDGVDVRIALFQRRDEVRRGLACSVLGTSEDITASKSERNGFFLNRRGPLEAHLEDAHEELSFEVVVLKFVAAGLGDVFGLDAVIRSGEVKLGLPVVFFWFG